MRTSSSIAFLSLAIVVNTAISLILKQSVREDRRYAVALLATALLLAPVSALCYMKALTIIDLGVAYPAFAAGSVVSICIVSRCAFGETISMNHLLGMAMIIGGIVLVCVK